MSRETENALLLLVGVSTVMITVGGAYARYVKPSLQPWLLAAGVILTLLALASIVGDIRRGPVSPDLGDQPGDHHHRPGVAWVLLIPIALLAIVVPPAIGPQTARPTATAGQTDAPRRPFPPLPDGRAPELSLPDLLIRLAQDSAGTLRDRLVTVTGFTMKDGNHLALGRVVIICCAADAQLARIDLDGPAAAAADGLPDGTWLRVEGKVPVVQIDSTSRTSPVMTISHADRITPPTNTYSY
ncbi:TIGR03943 family protein [Mycolicibacterium sp. 018/SC-01/001]|uniref:TIGR03943 family putative permease subunit n=1 Tax=Mycolicibacterium sp. 018/SC-01/001 TaxID=2592069 RepID=UPI00117EB07D|nr:TIGR03943 family protein [Mycolicibacterium sp. 018/SC-01/001]TRW80015.1 TIGR03943 family protein [Mycolicibacterium sp. 018/SC-01/001]